MGDAGFDADSDVVDIFDLKASYPEASVPSVVGRRNQNASPCGAYDVASASKNPFLRRKNVNRHFKL